MKCACLNVPGCRVSRKVETPGAGGSACSTGRGTLFCINDLDTIRELWREYWASIGLPGDFQNFDEELASLPGVYQRLLTTRVDGALAGMIALRPVAKQSCEVKRLYVRPEYRGRGLARKLIAEAIAEARALGYTQMFCDTLPSMQSALALYRSIGFVETEPYSERPTPGAIFLRLTL